MKGFPPPLMDPNQATVPDLKMELKSRNSELEELRKRILRLTEENEELRLDKRSFRDFNVRLTRDLDRVSNELEQERDLMRELREENDRLRTALKEPQVRPHCPSLASSDSHHPPSLSPRPAVERRLKHASKR